MKKELTQNIRSQHTLTTDCINVHDSLHSLIENSITSIQELSVLLQSRSESIQLIIQMQANLLTYHYNHGHLLLASIGVSTSPLEGKDQVHHQHYTRS